MPREGDIGERGRAWAWTTHTFPREIQRLPGLVGPDGGRKTPGGGAQKVDTVQASRREAGCQDRVINQTLQDVTVWWEIRRDRFPYPRGCC